MKIITTSDLHGYLPDIKEEFDLLLICGDVCPATNHSLAYQHLWCTEIFIKWLNELPYRDERSHVVMVWGNHDFIGEKMPEVGKIISEKTNGRAVVLSHDIFVWETVDGTKIKIFGTPYCAIFGAWAFMRPDDELDRLYSQIPEGIDILLSHDSPNIWKMGAILQGRWKSDTTGNRVLPTHLIRIKPRFYFSGHFHSGNHKFEEREGIWCANVSYVDEMYEPVQPLLKVSIENGVINHEYLSVKPKSLLI